MTLLAVSTATPRLSVASWQEGRLLAEGGHVDEMRHAERLFEVIDEVLAAAGRDRGDLRALACDVGPGSFTGVRVGVSSCLGIALALNLPLVPVRSLEAMAVAAFADEPGAEEVVAVLDAKRGELFYEGYRRTGEVSLAGGFGSAEAARAALEAHHRPGTRYCGLAASEVAPSGATLTGPRSERPHAAVIAGIAAERLARGHVPSLAEIDVVYLRAPDAKKPTLPPNLLRKA
ncbi:MAG: tRNA (adenosine(37)-N6)-threonylcarbamoyltransferase complex dimerization subunit type 1 TsaB [Polyangiaceae bacterium]